MLKRASALSNESPFVFPSTTREQVAEKGARLLQGVTPLPPGIYSLLETHTARPTRRTSSASRS